MTVNGRRVEEDRLMKLNFHDYVFFAFLIIACGIFLCSGIYQLYLWLWSGINELVKRGDIAALKKRINKKGDIEERDSYGRTPLINAVNNGCSDMVEFLINYGANIHYKTYKGNNAIYFAIKRGDFKIAQDLIRNGVVLEPSYLLSVVEEGKTEVLQNLLAGFRTNLNVGDYSKTLLMVASQRGYVDIVNLLLSKGADVNAKEKECGYTALMYAIEFGHIKTVETLLDRGVDVSKQGRRGRDALELAEEEGNKNIVELIRKYNNLEKEQYLWERTVKNVDLEELKEILTYEEKDENKIAVAKEEWLNYKDEKGKMQTIINEKLKKEKYYGFLSESKTTRREIEKKFEKEYGCKPRIILDVEFMQDMELFVKYYCFHYVYFENIKTQKLIIEKREQAQKNKWLAQKNKETQQSLAQKNSEIQQLRDEIQQKNNELKQLKKIINSDKDEQAAISKRQEKKKKKEDWIIKQMREEADKIREEGKEAGLSEEVIEKRVGLSNARWWRELEKIKHFK